MNPKRAEIENRQFQWSEVVSRRALLKTSALTIGSLILPGTALATLLIRPGAADSWSIPTAASRALAFHNVHTGEALKIVYFENGEYIAGALQEIDYFFRDFRANQIKPIDPRLLDLLHRIHLTLGASQPFSLISGYRSPATNAWLASRTEGVSHHSMHIEGRAADINVPGCDLATLQQAALALRGGGVGYYPRSNFVHVDTGRVRRW